MIVDRRGRRFRNLRISLTAACNYACTYCVPEGRRLNKAKGELSTDAFLTAVHYLIETAGIERLRITGGDPMVTPRFDAFLPAAMQLPLKDVSFTTNGQLLERKFDVIRRSGIGRINISLDTLNPIKFRRIAHGGDLATVLRGIDLALHAGLRVKMNMVPMRTVNADEVVPLLDFCLQRGIELRYIELMRMGHLSAGPAFDRDYLSMPALLDLVGEHYEFERADAPYDSTAQRFHIPGKGTFGIIANESAPFCASCTRLRLSADGYLYGCLSNTNRHYIADLLDEPRHVALPKLQSILSTALADK